MFRAMSRRFDTATINLALAILHGVLGRVATRTVGTVDVRLALRVLYRHVPTCPGLAEFWRQASSDAGHPWESGHLPYREIVRDLTAAGWPIEPRYRDWP